MALMIFFTIFINVNDLWPVYFKLMYHYEAIRLQISELDDDTENFNAHYFSPSQCWK